MHFDANVNKSRWPLLLPFPPNPSYIRVPGATGLNRSHLNGAFLVQRWALSLSLSHTPFSLLFPFFIVLSCISVRAYESRSACVGLFLQARGDWVELTHLMQPQGSHIFVPFWRSGAVSETCRCTHSQLKQQIHTCRRGSCTRLSRAPSYWWTPTRFLPRCASRWQSCHINFFPQSPGFNFHNRKKKISTFISAEIVISAKTVELSPKFMYATFSTEKKRFQNSRYSYSTYHLLRKCYIYEENQRLNIYFSEHHKKCIIFLLL